MVDRCYRQIWNHPDVLYTAAQKQKKNSLVEDNDIDFEEIQEAAAGAKKTGSKAGKPGAAPVEQNNQSSPRPMHEMNKAFAMMDRKDQSVGYEWVCSVHVQAQSNSLIVCFDEMKKLFYFAMTFSQAISSRWQMDKRAFGLSRVKIFSIIYVGGS